MALKKISSILMLCAVTMGVMAVPARRGGVLRMAEDGTEKMVYLHGDAFFHYMTDSEGRWLNEKTLQPLSETESVTARKSGVARAQSRKAKMIGGEPNIAPRGLVILVNFSDKAFVTPKDTIDSMMNGANFTRRYNYDYYYGGKQYIGTTTAEGSARKYFQDQSYGQYNPVFDVVGPYTISQNQSYYGSNNSHGDDMHVDAMVREACQLADNDGADFTLYDNDGNGVVDFVYFIYAGEGEADGGASNTIWPHNWHLTYYGGSNLYLDGKLIDNYACSNEINHYSAVYAGLGTFCHEFSHVIGLPDLYCTDGGVVSPHTLNEWDILDYGPYNNDGNTPPAYSAYERFYCGWLTPRVLNEAENVTLQVIDSAEALLMCSGNQHNLVGYNPNPKTFYLLEARNQTGWDLYLPGSGMLITKIQYSASKWQNNTVNNTASAMGVDIIEATPNTTTGRYQYAKATDAYPEGGTSWTSFTDHEVTNIARDSATGTITFKFRGGRVTDIESATSEQRAQKILRDGRIVIIRDNKEYDILGHENHQL